MEAQRWAALQKSDCALASPFFSLEFARLAARLRPVELAVIEVDQRIAGFWAFEQRSMGLAVPLAFPISDYHGPLLAPDCELSASQLLRACRRQLYWFAGLPAKQRLFAAFHSRVEPSPIVRTQRLGLSDQRRKWRRLGREVGDVRFELNCRDPRVLDRLIVWKRAKAARTGVPDLFDDPWTRTFLHELHRSAHGELRAWLSVLWAGEQPVAGHFGIASTRAWHWWFASYDPDYGRHSPGLLMLHAMLEAAPAQGIEWLDFGPGAEEFKHRYANDSIPVAFGTASRPLARVLLGVKRRVENTLRKTPLHAALRHAVDRVGRRSSAARQGSSPTHG